jgi:hypothetical protein
MNGNQEFDFYRKDDIYRNYTLSDLHIEGDIVNDEVLSQNITRGDLDGGRVTLPTDFYPDQMADVGLRAAMYCGESDGFITFSLLFLTDEEQGTVAQSYTTTLQQDVSNVIIDANVEYVRENLGYPVNDPNRKDTFSNFYKFYYLAYEIGGTPAYYLNLTAFKVVNLATNIPLFDTRQHAEAYLRDLTNMTTEGLLNGEEQADPEAAYDYAEQYWYINNVIGHNTKNRINYTHVRNYRLYPKTGKICLVKITPTPEVPYNWKLMYNNGYDWLSAPAYSQDYHPTSEMYSQYLSKNILFSDDNYYTVFSWQTNIPRVASEEDAEKYLNDELDPSEFLDFHERVNDNPSDPLAPDFGTEITDTPTGTNGQHYNIAGCRMYAMTGTELSRFFLELFDPVKIDDILNGTKLFGSSEISALLGCMFLPISDVSTICDLGGTDNIFVGSWRSENAEGTRIAQNNKTLTMGSANISEQYASELDYEPWTQLYIMLPYCGVYQLQCSKYTGRVVRCDYAVDIVSGACTAYLYAGEGGGSKGLLLDSSDGNMGSQRAITAVDQAQYVSNIVNGVMGGSATVSSGASMVGRAAHQAAGMGSIGGAAGIAGAAGIGAGIGVAGVGVASSGIYKGFETLQAAETIPMSTRGGNAGNLGYFGIQKPMFIVIRRACVRPGNEKEVIGYPSGQGGTVGSFSGYLKCSAFKIADGFTGSQQELNEIVDIMSAGIYL